MSGLGFKGLGFKGLGFRRGDLSSRMPSAHIENGQALRWGGHQSAQQDVVLTSLYVV
jgi:hypothetical protein